MIIINSDYSITQCFLTKTVNVFVRDDEDEDNPETQEFQILLPTIRQIMEDKDLIIVYQLIVSYRLQEIFHAEDKSDLFVLKLLLLEFGKYDKFGKIYDLCLKCIPKIIPGFTANFNDKELKINNITITDEI